MVLDSIMWCYMVLVVPQGGFWGGSRMFSLVLDGSWWYYVFLVLVLGGFLC